MYIVFCTGRLHAAHDGIETTAQEAMDQEAHRSRKLDGGPANPLRGSAVSIRDSIGLDESVVLDADGEVVVVKSLSASRRAREDCAPVTDAVPGWWALHVRDSHRKFIDHLCIAHAPVSARGAGEAARERQDRWLSRDVRQ